MADEVLKRDQNFVTVLGGITNDSVQQIRMLRVDPVSGSLLVTAQGGGTGGITTVTDGITTVTSATELTFTGATVTNLGGGNAEVTITGGSGSPGGLNTQIQYNNNGVFGGISGAVTDGTAVSLTAPHLLNPTINGAGAGLATLTYPNTATSVSIAFPATTGTVALTSQLTSGTVTSVATNSTLTGGPITTTGTLGINLSNANTWGALQTFGTNISIGGVTATGATGTGNSVFGTSPTITGATLTTASVNGVTLTTGGGTTTFLNANGAYSTPAGSGGLTVGTTTITSGTSGRILYDNAGVLGEKTVTGTGNVVLDTLPTLTTPIVNNMFFAPSGTASEAFYFYGKGGATIPVPFFYPSTANTSLAFDISPNGTPGNTFGIGPTWIDLLSTDVNNANYEVLRISKRDGGNGYITTAQGGTGSYRDFVLQYDYSTSTIAGNVGIGFPTPTFSLEVVSAGTSAFQARNTGFGGSSGGAGLIGTTGILPVAQNDRLGFLLLGYSDGTTSRNSAGMVGYANQAWTAGSAQGSYLTFETTANGASSRTERMRVASTGVVTIANLSTGLVKATSGALSIATAGTDYLAPTGTLTTGSALFATSGQIDQDNANYFYDSTNHRLGFLTTAPTHTITLANTGQQVFYNTTDQVTNFERVRFDWASNNFIIQTEAGGTGTIRGFTFSGMASTLNVGSDAIGSSAITARRDSTGSGFIFAVTSSQLTSSSAAQNAITVATKVLQTGTASYRGIWVTPWISSKGSNGALLMDLGTNTAINASGTHTTKFNVDDSGNVTATGNLSLTAAGNKISIATGTNASVGTATLVGGTVTVSTTAVTASSKIFLTDATTGVLTNIGTPTVGTIVAGTSFVINSSNVLDSSAVNWLVIN